MIVFIACVITEILPLFDLQIPSVRRFVIYVKNKESDKIIMDTLYLVYHIQYHMRVAL